MSKFRIMAEDRNGNAVERAIVNTATPRSNGEARKGTGTAKAALRAYGCRVIRTDSDGNVYAVGSRTGKRIWAEPVSGKAKSANKPARRTADDSESEATVRAILREHGIDPDAISGQTVTVKSPTVKVQKPRKQPQTTQTENSEMDTLFCANGEHTWQRPKQRGRKPHSCPEHADMASVATLEQDAPKPRVTRVARNVGRPAGKSTSEARKERLAKAAVSAPPRRGRRGKMTIAGIEVNPELIGNDNFREALRDFVDRNGVPSKRELAALERKYL